jgi:hypothetical protein
MVSYLGSHLHSLECNEVCVMPDARRNRTSNISSGLFSSTLVPEHHNDGDLVFDQVQYVLLAIAKWNALTEFE